jgi:hypothetical protein
MNVHASLELFGKPATSEVNRIFVCLFGGTVYLCALHGTDIILWFTGKTRCKPSANPPGMLTHAFSDQATIRGFWLTLEFSSVSNCIVGNRRMIVISLTLNPDTAGRVLDPQSLQPVGYDHV